MSTSWTWKIVSHSLLWLLFLAAIVVAAKEKQPGKKLRGVMIFALQNGEIVELQKEHGFDVLTTQFEMPSLIPSDVVASSRTTVHMVRLPGDKSKVRFPQGSGFNLLAEFAAGTEPGSLQLMRFGTQGRQRITYTRPWNDSRPGTRSVWNTVAFKAGMRKDGKWVLLPPDDLPVGEYCFSLVNTDENSCFGVDPAP